MNSILDLTRFQISRHTHLLQINLVGILLLACALSLTWATTSQAQDGQSAINDKDAGPVDDTSPVKVSPLAWTAPGTVLRVYGGYTDGSVRVSGLPLSTSWFCPDSAIHFSAETSDPDMILRLAMAAQLSGKHLTCMVDTSTCIEGHQVGYQCYIGL